MYRRCRLSERQVHRQLLPLRAPAFIDSVRSRLPGQRSPTAGQNGSGSLPDPARDDAVLDLERRRDELTAKVAELTWDLGGLVYEMATRDRIRIDVLVRRAASLQNVDAELHEVERILRLEQHSTAGQCASCGAPHSSGAAYCWQCGQPLLEQVPTDAISSP